jgi:hypothetical protein
MTKKNKAFLCSAKKALARCQAEKHEAIFDCLKSWGKKQFASQIGVSLLTRHQKNNFAVGKL